MRGIVRTDPAGRRSWRHGPVPVVIDDAEESERLGRFVVQRSHAPARAVHAMIVMPSRYRHGKDGDNPYPGQSAGSGPIAGEDRTCRSYQRSSGGAGSRRPSPPGGASGACGAPKIRWSSIRSSHAGGATTLEGRRVEAVRRWGKQLWWELDARPASALPFRDDRRIQGTGGGPAAARVRAARGSNGVAATLHEDPDALRRRRRARDGRRTPGSGASSCATIPSASPRLRGSASIHCSRCRRRSGFRRCCGHGGAT